MNKWSVLREINPVTAPACKMFVLNDAQTCLHANSIFSHPITSVLNAMHFDGDPFTCHCENEDKKA